MSARLVIGLGNPGKEYEDTRHNLGFRVVTKLAEKYEARFAKSVLLKGSLAKGETQQGKAYFFMPLTYMNNSGIAVTKAVHWRNVALEDILVVCDDLNLDFGKIRLRLQGSDGGHNGLRSIKEHLKTNEFARLRLGIGGPSNKGETAEFVLSKFTSEEKKGLKDFVDQAVDCCSLWLEGHVNQAMNQFNKKGER
ncbi:MAG: aminoacyl-tRNA hydrolase [Candidatus Omnitrophota bacterium]